MSARELVYNIIDEMTEEQLTDFLKIFGKLTLPEKKLKKQAQDAIDECERLLADPNTRKYSAEEAVKELKL